MCLSRTTETITRTTVDGYTLPPETLDDLARTTTSVFGAVFAQPRVEIKVSLNLSYYDRE